MKKFLLFLLFALFQSQSGCTPELNKKEVRITLQAWVNLMPVLDKESPPRGKILLTVTGIKGPYNLKNVTLFNEKGDTIGVFPLRPLEEKGRFISDALPLQKDDGIFGEVVLSYRSKKYTFLTDTVRVRAVY